MALPVRLSVLRGLAKEISASAGDRRPVAVGGPLAEVLRRELARGGDPAAVRETDDPRGAAVFVYVLGRGVGAADEEILERARRARVPIVAVSPEDVRVPYVLATDLVPLPPGAGFPVDAIARAIARKLGEDATALAARLPVLRGAVCGQLVAAFARRNAIVAAAVFVPGADLPVLSRNQLRLVLRIAAAHGQDIDRERIPEVAATLGAGLGLRALARELLDLVPVAGVPAVGWAVQGGIAYAGTRALGEAAVQWFAARARAAGAPVGDRSAPTPQPGGVAPAAP